MAESIVIPTFYEYLNERKIPDAERTDQRLDKLRSEYNRYRNRLYKKRQRESKREVTVYLDRTEHKKLKQAAQHHQLVLSQFIKQSSLKYVDGTFITPDTATLRLVLAELNAIRNQLEKMSRKRRGVFSGSHDTEEIRSVLHAFQTGLLQKMTSPSNVEQWILEELNRNPSYKSKLIALLLSYV